MKCAVFVTGTDTGVGKTVVAAGLALVLRDAGFDVGVMKPVVTGCRSRRGKFVSEDVEYLVSACGCDDERDLVSPYMLREPLAPEVAAGLQNVRIDIRKIIRAFGALRRRHDVLIVEGAGGLFVPIKPKYFMIELVTAMSVPLIVVARPGLGTINHTLLSCEVARAREIDVVGVVINNYAERPSLAERTNPDVLRRYARAPLLGIMPHLPGVSVEERKYGRLSQTTEDSIDVRKVLDHLRRTSR